MRTTRDDPELRGFPLGLAILALGVAIGALVDPLDWLTAPPAELMTDAARVERDAALHPFLVPAAAPDAVPDNGLDTLRITLDGDAARRLQAVRDRAMDRGIIQQEDDDTVQGVVEHEGERLRAELRIKGDWTDHVETDKWSLRVSLLDGKLLGMRTFSVQSPDTRGKMWEWLALAALRREDVLAPRGTFVNVVVNGHSTGVYYLEEHFAKELLESQGRREGPIVLLDEDTRWATMLQAHDVLAKGLEMEVPAPLRPALDAGAAAPRAFGEKRLSSIEGLARQLDAALAQMDALRELAVAEDSRVGALRRLEALERVQGASIDAIFDVERLGRAHAVASVFQVFHSLVWHNLRFYHDPVLDRLEPIPFDNMPDVPSGRDPVPFRMPEVAAVFGSSKAYYDATFRHLARMVEPAWLDDLFDDVGPDLERFQAALLGEGNLIARYRIDGMKQRLRAQQAYLAGVLHPADPVNLSATWRRTSPEGAPLVGTAEVHAWATTGTPAVLVGFRFSNGATLSAREVLASDPEAVSADGPGTVVLPHDGRPAVFRFSLDARLANLENVAAIKRAIREEAADPDSLDLAIDAVFRPLPASGETAERLLFRRTDPGWTAEGGRPDPPTLAQALERHPCLAYDVASGRLRLRPGTWDVEGDLVVPRGHVLHAAGPLTLRFAGDAVLVAEDALDWRGTADAPIVLEPQEGAERWRGIAVLGAAERSTWRHVTVRRTDAVTRGGWIVTGGITFYHAPVDFADCAFEGTFAEDGLNLFGLDFTMERTVFRGCASDSFDGDFVRGRVGDCRFEDGLADGIDLSGSDVEVEGCAFANLGDKALSIGEHTDARVRGGTIEACTVGIASKDSSRVEVVGTTIRGTRHYALAAYVKKPEFGPAELRATNVTIEGSGLGDHIAQTGCTIELDGTALATQDVDVERMYAEKILGQ